jgi:mRNA-degrading endonuclease RelE of RelBE toxin-antitoxin system
MVIRETSVFTKRVQRLLDKDSYRILQLKLVAEPDAGALVPGSGGLRKIRWEGAGRGKRGGVRVIYYWAVASDVILMLMIYGKNERDDLTKDQLKTLGQIVREEFK